MTTPIAFLRQMLDAGMDLQMAMTAAETFETSAKAEHDRLVKDLLDRLSVDAKAEKRRAKDRARKAATKDGIPRNSAESAEFAETKDVPPTPPSENNPIPPLKGGTFPQNPDASPPEKPTGKPLATWAAEIWDEAPLVARQRSGRQQAETALKAAVKRGADPAAVKAGLAAYYASPDATKNHAEYAAGVHRAIQRDLWQSYAEPETPVETEDPWPRRLLNWRVNSYWNSDWGPKPGKPGYLGPESEMAA